jgi:hypothetical protein
VKYFATSTPDQRPLIKKAFDDLEDASDMWDLIREVAFHSTYTNPVSEAITEGLIAFTTRKLNSSTYDEQEVERIIAQELDRRKRARNKER